MTEENERPASEVLGEPRSGRGIPLASLKPGEQATVVAVGGSRVFRRRLLELGLVPGTVLAVVNVAPLGDPLELELRGSRLSIRREQAEAIKVVRPSRHLPVLQ